MRSVVQWEQSAHLHRRNVRGGEDCGAGCLGGERPRRYGWDITTATSHHFHGYLDDVSIYHRALTNAEIANLANNTGQGRYEYHHTNALGSNIVLTDDRKNVIARYEYDVFGAVRSADGHERQHAQVYGQGV